MYYEKVFGGLNEHKVRYLVVDGIAVNLYGVLRATADLDLVLDMSNQNLSDFVNCMEKLGYHPRVPVKASEFIDPTKRKEWKETKGKVVFSFFHLTKSQQEIDIFIDSPIDFEKAYKKKTSVTAKGIKIPLISINDLIKLKRISGRNQDLADVEALERVKKILKEKKNEKP